MEYKTDNLSEFNIQLNESDNSSSLSDNSSSLSDNSSDNSSDDLSDGSCESDALNEFGFSDYDCEDEDATCRNFVGDSWEDTIGGVNTLESSIMTNSVSSPVSSPKSKTSSKASPVSSPKSKTSSKASPVSSPKSKTSSSYMIDIGSANTSQVSSPKSQTGDGNVVMSDYITTESTVTQDVKTEELRPNNLQNKLPIVGTPILAGGSSMSLDIDTDITVGMTEFLSQISF
jgi:hypothetical protein